MSYNQPPPPPPGYGAPGGEYGAAPQGTNKKAIWSMVTGIVGLLCCGILGPVAIFLSKGAKRELSATGQQGGSMATAGMILGVIATVFLVIQIILVATGNFYFSLET